MRRNNAIPADKVFARGVVVSLLIPKALRLAGELRRVFARVVQHTRAGYQLNTQWGLISGRHQHSQLNEVTSTHLEIPTLTPQTAKRAEKYSLAKIAELMNIRPPVRAMQRAGRARASKRARVDDTEEEIEVEVLAEESGVEEEETLSTGPSTRRSRRGRHN